MDLNEAKRMCLEEMDRHLTKDRYLWHFSWMDDFNTLGRCKRVLGNGYIMLNHEYVKRAEVADVRDTILHEIAHALAPPRECHGRIWKLICMQIGADPSRTTNSPAMKEANAQMANYVAECNECHTKHYAMKLGSRMKSGRLHCSKCARRHGFNDSNRLIYKRA